MNTDGRKTPYNWKGTKDIMKEKEDANIISKPPNDWNNEKNILLKKIVELEKELKFLKKENQDLSSKINNNNQGMINNSSGSKAVPNSGHSSNSSSSITNQFWCNANLTLSANLSSTIEKKLNNVLIFYT
jgi:hypothetical protein